MQTKEQKAEYRRQWVIKNKEKHNATNKAWALRNREKHLKIQRESYHRNKEKNRLRRLERATTWYYKNKAELLPRKVAQYQQRVNERREIIFNHYGRQCACCGFSDVRFLTIDHVFHGKGNKLPRKERKTGTPTILQKIIDSGFPKEFQLLCMNCNWAKAVYKVCPHQSDGSNGSSVSERELKEISRPT